MELGCKSCCNRHVLQLDVVNFFVVVVLICRPLNNGVTRFHGELSTSI